MTEDLSEKIKKAEKEVSSLKSELDKLNETKEYWFSKKADISKSKDSKIDRVKQLKKERNTLTNKVRDLKKERDKLNKEISDKVKDIVKHKQSLSPEDRKLNPAKLKSEMDALEFKLETEPMSFEAEQRLMKKVKDLRKKLSTVSVVDSSKLREQSKEADSLKDKANNIHKDMREKADKSQKLHEEFIQTSKAIDELKKEEEEAYNKFFNYKKTFNDLNNKLKDYVTKLRAMKGTDKPKVPKVTEKDVEEKLSKKRKLTTEDLLMLQRKPGKK